MCDPLHEQPDTIESRLADRTQELLRVSSELHQARADLDRLTQWMETARQDASAIRRSWRWRIGNRLVRIATRLLRRPGRAQALDQLEQVFGDYRRWARQRADFVHRTGRDAQLDPGAQEVFRHLVPPSAAVSLPPWEHRSEDGVSVVVVHCNGMRLLDGLLRSLRVIDWPRRWELMVVDFASEDDSRRVLDTIATDLPLRVIALKERQRNAECSNLAVAKARYPWLLLLDGDVELKDPDTVQRALRALHDRRIGAVGLKLFHPAESGRFGRRMQHAGVRFRVDHRAGILCSYNLETSPAALPVGDAYYVPAVRGAVVCRRDDYLSVGGLVAGDDDGCEAIGLCLTLRAKLGLKCIVLNNAGAENRPMPTAKTRGDASSPARGEANCARVPARFAYMLRRAMHAERLRGEVGFSADPIVIGFVVSGGNQQSVAGDRRAALEMGQALMDLCAWHVRIMPANQKDPNSFNVSGLDVLVVLDDCYDLGEVRHARPGLLTIAWMHQCIDRWTLRDWFDRYDLCLCPSHKVAERIQRGRGKPAYVLQPATNASRFTPAQAGALRDIDCYYAECRAPETRTPDPLAPDNIRSYFGLFEFGADDQPQCRPHPYLEGRAPPQALPSIYRRSRIVIDDTTPSTNPSGALKQGVFDALAAGALVVTNNKDAARETFADLMPTYADADELRRQLRHYLQDGAQLASSANTLREQVLAAHTYGHRAQTLQRILVEAAETRWRIAIKVPAPKQSQAHTWGDYHFALSLARAIGRAGHLARIDLLPDWYATRCMGDDVVIALRGLRRYEPRSDHINLMWNISHPDAVDDSEYNSYDEVFIASVPKARDLAARLRVPASPLLQCTDPHVFYPDPDPAVAYHPLLFVGNSRKQFRAIVRDALAANLRPAVYGHEWEGLIPADLIHGHHIPNDSLRKAYSRCGILLNDHWHDMRSQGFLSNRLFDAAACGSVIVTDDVAGVLDIFGDAISVYNGTPGDLAEIASDIDLRRDRYSARAGHARALVMAEHTFDHRAEELLRAIRLHHMARALEPAGA